MKFKFVGLTLAAEERLTPETRKEYGQALDARRLLEVTFRVEPADGLPHKITVMVDASNVRDEEVVTAAKAKLDEITEQWADLRGGPRYA